MNATCRQAEAPRPPVLSYDMPVRAKASGSGSPFHSLHATSQALQPMQSVVSVKKPTVRAIASLLSDRHQIGHDLGVAALLDVEVERKCNELVDDRHRFRVLAKIDRDHVAPARFARVGPQLRKALAVGKDRKLARGVLAAADTRHPLVN